MRRIESKNKLDTGKKNVPSADTGKKNVPSADMYIDLLAKEEAGEGGFNLILKLY